MKPIMPILSSPLSTYNFLNIFSFCHFTYFSMRKSINKVKSANFLHFIFCYFGSVMSFSAIHRKFNIMSGVTRHCSPFKIFKLVVKCIAIFMVNYCFRPVGIWQKQCRQKSVYSHFFYKIFMVKPHHVVAHICKTWFNALNFPASRISSLNRTILANTIVVVQPRDSFPSHNLKYGTVLCNAKCFFIITMSTK